MKNTIIKWLERPQVIIPAALVAAIVVGLIASRFVGRPPTVDFSFNPSQISSSTASADNSVDLAFPKVGRLASLAVTLGSPVKAGDILATLDAGDSLGAVNQAKGALELAKAQSVSLAVQYANAKKQQDTLVANAYRTLLSSNLVAVAQKADYDKTTAPVDNNQVLQISGTYNCDKEGSYEISPYASGVTSGYSFTFSGLEAGEGSVTNYTPQPLGACGLYVQFPVGYSGTFLKWVIDIPNKNSAGYAANKNAYDLAVATRDQVLKQLEANLGRDGSADANIAQAAIDSAQGAYEVALAAYRNNLLVAPADGVVTFVDPHLNLGELVNANKTVITIAKNNYGK